MSWAAEFVCCSVWSEPSWLKVCARPANEAVPVPNADRTWDHPVAIRPVELGPLYDHEDGHVPPVNGKVSIYEK